jgi:hypothetical protein
MVQYSSRNRIQHIIQLLEHFDISKSQEINAERFDESLTFLVSCLGSALKMGVSIKLNSKSEFRTVEVNNVGYTVLSAKLVAQ